MTYNFLTLSIYFSYLYKHVAKLLLFEENFVYGRIGRLGYGWSDISFIIYIVNYRFDKIITEFDNLP